MTDGFPGLKSALILSKSDAQHVTNSDVYGFRVPVSLCGKGDVLCDLKNPFFMGIGAR